MTFSPGGQRLANAANRGASGSPRVSTVRVLWISHYPVFGGPHNIPLRLAPALAKAGIETTMVLPEEPGGAADRLVAAGIPVLRLPLHRLRRTRDPRVHASMIRQVHREVAGIRSAIRSGGHDIVVLTGLTNPHGALAARARTDADRVADIGLANPWYIREPAMAMVRRCADVVMFTGRTVESMHTRLRPLRQPSVLFTLPVDTDRYRPIGGAERAAIRAERSSPGRLRSSGQ